MVLRPGYCSPKRPICPFLAPAEHPKKPLISRAFFQVACAHFYWLPSDGRSKMTMRASIVGRSAGNAELDSNSISWRRLLEFSGEKMNKMFRAIIIVVGCLGLAGCHSAEYRDGREYGQKLRKEGQLTKASGRKVGDSTLAIWFRKMNEEQVTKFVVTYDHDAVVPPEGTPGRTQWVKGFKDAMK